MYKRPYYKGFLSRMQEPRRFIQVISGPRQCGKTFLVKQLIDAAGIPSQYAPADEPSVRDRAWIEQQWEVGRARAREAGTALLVLDELQKIEGWSEVVKRLWDADSFSGTSLLVVILGSSPLLIQRGLTESLAGRFEILHLPHWSFAEMHDAFGWDLDRFLFFGGYPGAAPLIQDEERWRRYILESLVETTISKDVLLMKRIDKPALLRRLFHLGCEYSGQVLSYQKMLGQLQDAGNTTTLAHYLDLLSKIWMLCGLEKYAGQKVRRRGSSPKLQVFNTAVMSAVSGMRFQEARANAEWWGRLVESAVGVHLINALTSTTDQLSYWREGNREVDFVVARGERLLAIEVKSGKRRERLAGSEEFSQKFKSVRLLLVGMGGMPLEEFLTTDVTTL
jgi:uncharacterized protein